MTTMKKPAITPRSGRYGSRDEQAMRPEFYRSVADALRRARSSAYRAVNSTMVEAYWNVGRMIVKEEQQGKERAEYGKFLIRNLSIRLTEEFGAGFDPSNLKRMRQFFMLFPKGATLWHQLEDGGKGATPWHLLKWSHFKAVLGVENPDARDYYLREAAEQNWPVHALERQINSLYYERLLMSRVRAPVEAEAIEKTTALAPTAADFI
jgi:hypothetical protein